MSAPLPVVDAAIWPSRDKTRFFVCEITPDDDPDVLPAVALPWALLEDAEFRAAVIARYNEMWDAWSDDPDADEDTAPTWLDALTAELRARVGGGE